MGLWITPFELSNPKKKLMKWPKQVKKLRKQRSLFVMKSIMTKKNKSTTRV